MKNKNNTKHISITHSVMTDQIPDTVMCYFEPCSDFSNTNVHEMLSETGNINLKHISVLIIQCHLFHLSAEY